VGFLNILLKILQGDAILEKKALFVGDLGLGFDLGFTYYPKRNGLHLV
jgi:hypothetical protein